MRGIFKDNTHAALLVDTTNAFNLVNCKAALHNISVLCCSILFYHLKEHLFCTHLMFITGEDELASTKGATQGNPLAMVMYALAVTALINSLYHHQMYLRLGLQMMLLLLDN